MGGPKNKNLLLYTKTCINIEYNKEKRTIHNSKAREIICWNIIN